MIHHVQLACPPGSEPVLPGLQVSGLDAWAARLRDAGYPVQFDDEFPGMRRFYTHDPNGNRLEFLEPIAGGG